MKNIQSLIILSVSTLFIIPCLIMACTRGVRPEPAAGGVPDTVEWIGPHTIQASVTAHPTEGVYETARRESARDEAVCRAQRMIANTFVSTICDKMQGEPDYKWVDKTAGENLHGIITGDKILIEGYLKDQICRIVYKVRHAGLKSGIDRFQVKESSPPNTNSIISDACG